MQEMAWAHASHLDHGYARTRAEGSSWVIARQRIEMDRWPDWEESVTISTWLRPPGPVIVVRDFEFFVDGRKVGQAAAHWLVINHQTRRPSRLPFPDNPSLFRQDQHLSIEPDKIGVVDGLPVLAEFIVRHSDLDMNGHVNNTRFAQWVLDTLPLAYHAGHKLDRYQINFLAEARPGESLCVHGSPRFEASTMPFYGRRSSDQTLLFTVEYKSSV